MTSISAQPDDPEKKSMSRIAHSGRPFSQLPERNLGTIISRMNESQIETLTHYLLYELPETDHGFRYEGIHYNLNVYPER